MLESSVIHDPGVIDGEIDLGAILEAMLYYRRVHLLLNAESFQRLFRRIGPVDLKSLLSHPSISSTITPEHKGIHTRSGNGVDIHGIVIFQQGGPSPPTKGKLDPIDTFSLLASRTGRGEINKKTIVGILSNTKKAKYAEILKDPKAINERLLSMLSDDQSVKLFVQGVAATKGLIVDLDKLASMRTVFTQVSDSFMISSTPDLSEVVMDQSGAFTWAFLAASMMEYVIELHISDMYSSDVILRPDVADIAAARMDLSLQRAARTADRVTAFEQFAFDDAHIFGAAINDGRLSFQDGLRIIDQSQRFRQWTSDLSPDADLIKEYHKAVSKETILKKFPMNLIRFAFFNGSGMLSDSFLPGTGLIPSAIDNFIVDKIFGGWKPNLFVRNVQKHIDRTQDL